jgi:hypothetical protein
VSSWREQALIDAPLEVVWALIGDPNRYPEWAADVVEVTGLPSVDRGAEYRQVSKTPLGKAETTFTVEELEELREVKLRCLSSGYYSRWVLTEAQGSTFTEVELGMEPTGLQYRVLDATLMGKRWYRRITQETLDGLRAVAAREHPGAPDQ